MHKKLAERKDIVFVTVDCKEPREALDAFLKQQGAESLLTMHDEKGSISKSWGVESWPSNFVIDETGKVRAAGNFIPGMEEIIADFEVRQKLKEKK